MSKISKFLGTAERVLNEDQVKRINETVLDHKGVKTEFSKDTVRLIVEDEYDLVAKKMNELARDGESDEVISSRMRDMQVMYNEYMNTFEYE